MSILKHLDFQWASFSKKDSAIALSVSPAYAYENGKKTETIEGYTVEFV